MRVFGRDPAADPAGVLGRVGYLSEEPDLPGWMRVRELLRYTRAFYPTWDPAFAEEVGDIAQMVDVPGTTEQDFHDG